MLDPGERVLEQPVGGSKIALAGAADELAHRLECVLVGLRRGKDRRLKRVLNVAEDASCVLDLRAARELLLLGVASRQWPMPAMLLAPVAAG
jgi:hypothetical protein